MCPKIFEKHLFQTVFFQAWQQMPLADIQVEKYISQAWKSGFAKKKQ